MMKNRMPPATRARKPSTTITAIAQCGNDELPLVDCTFPLPAEFVDDGEDPSILVLDEPKPPPCAIDDAEDAAEAEEADATDATDESDATDRDDAAAADVEDIDAITKSAKVVSDGDMRKNGGKEDVRIELVSH